MALAQLSPGAGEARRWILHELSKSQYRQGDPSFVERVGATVNDWLSHAVHGVSAPFGPAGAIVLGAVVLVIAGIAVWWAGRPRRTGTASAPGAVFEQGRARTAAEHRRLASAAAADGDWGAAVRERFRALARGLDERTVLDLQPGRTAHEIGAQAAAAFPALTARLADAARIFDDVYYGDRPATPGDYRAVSDTDDACAGARPDFAPAARSEPGVSPE